MNIVHYLTNEKETSSEEKGQKRFLTSGSDVSPDRSAIYASRLYLNRYHITHPERLACNQEGGPKISGTWAALSQSLIPSLSK